MSGEGGGDGGGSGGGDGGGDGGGSGSGAGGYSGGGLNAGRSQAGGFASGLGSTGLGSGNTAGNGGFGTGIGGGSGGGFGGISIGANDRKGFAATVGASAAAAGAAAVSASTTAQQVQPSALTSFVDTLSKQFAVVSNVANFALNPNPISKVSSAIALGKMASDSGFSFGSPSSPGAEFGGTIGGLNFGNSNSPNRGYTLESNGSVYRSNTGGIVFSSQTPSEKNSSVQSANGVANSVSNEQKGDVATAKVNSQLVTQKPFDIFPILLTIGSLVLFKG